MQKQKRKVETKIYVDILNGNISLQKGFRELKIYGSASGIETVFNKVKNSNTKCGKELRRLLFPDKYDQLRVRRKEYVCCDLKKELLWGKILLKSCAEKITLFAEDKRKFENCILLGKYSDAKNILVHIKELCGCSLWSMEQEFLLCELESGLQANKNLQNQLNLKIRSSWVKSFADFFSLKAEKNLNANQYRARVIRRLKKLKKEAKIYFQMHLMMDTDVRNVHWEEVLYYANGSSIIDYYIDYLKVCCYIMAAEETPEEIRQYIRYFSNDLKKVLPGSVLDKLAFDGNDFSFSSCEDEIHKIGVAYTKGEYSQVIEQCATILKENGNIFEIYEYYVKSCIICGYKEPVLFREQKQQSKEPGRCLRDLILMILYELYRKEEGVERAYDETHVILRYLNGFSISAGLYNFYCKEMAYYFSDFWKKYLAYQSQYHNIRDYFLFSDELKVRYLEIFERRHGYSPLIAIYKMQTDPEKETDIGEIEELRLEWYNIKTEAAKGNYSIALEKAEQYKKNQSLYVKEYLKEDLMLLIFDMKVKLGMLQEALEMMVDTFLDNSYMAIRIDWNRLYKKLEAHISEDIKKTIAMPILSYLVNKDKPDQVFVDFANFMDAQGISRVKDMLDKPDAFGRKRLIYFLKNICVVDIMDSMFLVFENEREVLEERLAICQALRQMDPQSEGKYIDEIGLITQRQILLNDIQYLDEQKIDFDMGRIHSNYKERFDENFKRYKEIGQIWQEIQCLTVNDQVFYTYIVDDKEENFSFARQNQKLGMFAELFSDLRDEIAFGQMGLDQSLGTRIRHGRLQNQIRRIFEQKHLIFLKKDDSSQEYIPINKESFQKLYGIQYLNGNQISALMKIMTEFTQKIDAIVTNLNQNAIRIHTENDYPKGIINLEYTNEDIWDLFTIGANYKSPDAMMELFEKDILSRIQSGLQDLGNHFREAVKTRYMNEIHLLEEQLQVFYNEAMQEDCFKKVHTNLIQCGTQIQQELEAIARWFCLPKTQEHPDYFMKDLLETCKATMRNINMRFDQADIHIENQTDSYWKGKTFSYFHEILIILFNNAFIHAGYKHHPENLEVRLMIIEDSEILRLEMETNLSEKKKNECGKIEERVNKVKSQLNQNSDRFYNKDTGSGYIKIENMLQVHIAPQSFNWLNFGLAPDKEHFFTTIWIRKDIIMGEVKESELTVNRR